MLTKSLWNSYADICDHSKLENDVVTDVAVIGGGITGLTAGRLLAQKGAEVAILESRRAGSGTTSHSTGNLYYTIDNILSSLESTYDLSTIKAVAESRIQGMQQIESWVDEYGFDCDYKSVPWYLYSSTDESINKIEEEYNTGEKTGLEMFKAPDSELPFPSAGAIKVPAQAQINPMRYVQELAQSMQTDECRIYEHTHVFSVEEKDKRYLLHTSGGTVVAEHVVHATHTPKGVQFVQTLLGPYREYGIACKVRNTNHPEGIFWGYYENGKKISTRTYSRDGDTFLIVVGEPHKVGQAEDNIRHIHNLESFARKHADVQEIVYRWGGQHYRPADLLPYIGPREKGSREYIATGFSTDGLVYGTLAGIMLSDIITGRVNPWTELYDSTRKQPLKSASKFFKENINVAKEYLKDLPGTAEETAFDELRPGEAEVIEKDGEKLAAYRNNEGKLEVRSAVCTHMECIVNWNNAEKSWDCPCHGSRFGTDGSVLEGPALHALHKVDISGDSVDVEDKH